MEPQFIRFDDVRSFVLAEGVYGRPLFGERGMFNLIEFEPGATVPLHSHPHEQLGIVLRGMQALVIDGAARELGPMEGYVLPGRRRALGLLRRRRSARAGRLLAGARGLPDPLAGRGMRPALVNGVWDVPSRFNFTRDVVEATAAENPTQRALAYIDGINVVRRFTFAELAILSAHWANLLRDVGVERSDRVLVVIGKKPEWHAVLLGALRLGAVTIPCPDLLRAKDLAFRARDSGARLLIADRAAEAEVEAMVVELEDPPLVVYLDEALSHLHDYEPRAPFADTHADEPAFILYTSGTTKNPKGVVHTHGYTFAKRMQAEHWLDARPGDLVWCTAGTGWAKSIWNVLLGPWSRGAEIVLHEAPFDPRERFELVDRLGVTVLCQAPTEYRLMAKLDELHQHDLSQLRHAVAAGEPLNPEVIKIFRDTFDVTIYDGYGQTENTLLVANGVGAHVRPGSMGLPTPGHEVDGDRRGGQSRRTGCGRGHRAQGSTADALRRLLAATGRDGGGVSRRLVRHRRPGGAR